MSDETKTYGEIAEERKLQWEKSTYSACDEDCWEAIAEAVIDEYKRRSELDTKPLPIEVSVTARGYEWDTVRNNWFPRVHADGDNYVEDSIG